MTIEKGDIMPNIFYVAKANGYNTSNYLINIFEELDLLREANKVCK